MSFCDICRLMPKPKPKLVIVACVLTTILVFQKYSPDQPDAVIQEAMGGGAEISRLSRNLQPDKLNLENKDIKKNIKVDVPYPHNNLHPEDLTLIDLHPFTMEINQDICNVSSIALVTIVHSAVQNDHARKVIRETWGNPTIPGVNTRLVFLVGQSGEPDKEAALKREAYQFNDIVQGDFLDTYHNLSYKNIFGKLWVSEFCEQAEFIVKTDDDMFIDLYGVYHITRQYLTQQKYLQDEFIFCPTHDGMGIIRDPASKWYASYEDVSKEEAPGNIYPAYCTGWIYILNPGTAKKLAEVAQTTKFFWIDDAWVTGILAKKLGIEHVRLNEYFVMLNEKILLSKSIQNPEIYNKDFLATYNAQNYELTYTLHQHAEWCYRNKCNNNIYQSKKTLSDTDLIVDQLMDKYKLILKSEAQG